MRASEESGSCVCVCVRSILAQATLTQAHLCTRSLAGAMAEPTAEDVLPAHDAEDEDKVRSRSGSAYTPRLLDAGLEGGSRRGCARRRGRRFLRRRIEIQERGEVKPKASRRTGKRKQNRENRSAGTPGTTSTIQMVSESVEAAAHAGGSHGTFATPRIKRTRDSRASTTGSDKKPNAGQKDNGKMWECPSMVRVMLKSACSGKELEFDVEPTTRVSALKTMVEQHWHVPPPCQEFLLQQRLSVERARPPPQCPPEGLPADVNLQGRIVDDGEELLLHLPPEGATLSFDVVVSVERARCYLRSDSALRRSAACRALADVACVADRHTIDALIQRLEDEDEGVRVAAMVALRRIIESGDDHVSDALSLCLPHDVSGVRHVVARLLEILPKT